MLSIVVHSDAADLPPNVLRKATETTIGITWSNNPLYQGLIRLAETQDLAIFLDRRADPDRPVSISIDEASVESALQRIAAKSRLGVGSVGPVLYIGPPRVASTIATVTALRWRDALDQPEELQQQLLRRRRVSWEELTEPAWLVEKLAAEIGLELVNGSRVPHDLWRAADLPPMNVPERLTLVLAGFGLTYAINGEARTIELQRYPRSASIEHAYRVGKAGTRVKQKVEDKFPQAFIRLDNEQLVVQSTLEDHWEIGPYVRGDRKPSPSAPVERQEGLQPAKAYSLQIKDQELRPLLDQLANRLNLTMIYLDGTNAALDKRVSFNVTQVTAEELLQTALGEAGLVGEIRQRTITVRLSD